jgi:hypothetical protein
MFRASRSGLLLILFLAGAARADDPEIVPAAEARSRDGRTCTVEMTVRSSKHAVPRKTYFLDSEADFKDPKNVAVLISDEDAASFRRAGIDDPAAHYKGKTIRVTGKVAIQRETNYVRIHVTSPDQIQVVD